MDRNQILENLRAYDPNFDEARINKAIDFAMRYHEGQVRASGEPYYYHPLSVAEIIIDMRLDSNSVITALLHDIVEDTELTIKDIVDNFGSEVAQLVDGVTKLSKIEFNSEHERQAENFRKLLVAMSYDIRVLLVKLADRLHNIRTLHYIKSPEKRQRIAMETMEIYAPLAERMGIQKIKTELQDICFNIVNPDISEFIKKKLRTLAVNEDEFINKIVQEINRTLESEDIKAEVYGRKKTPYSIWMKMEQKHLNIDQLSDIIAFRIIVSSITECYRVLGIIHTKYKMVPENFQDFISTPKSNGYQSLHTVVIGPLQQKIEIQIRDRHMHEVAELGVAAHWKYKQSLSDAQVNEKEYTWIRELIDYLEHNTDPEEFLQNTKLSMYYDQVFCFTPKGKLIALPKGATAVDFAYAVHSNVGHHCSGVKINGKIEQLKANLKNGDQVEIITSKTQTPNPAWERFVVTGKARSEIRRFTRSYQKIQYIALGKSMLEKAFKAAGIEDITKALSEANKLLKKAKIDDLYYYVAKGLISREEIVKQLLPKKTKLSEALSLLKLKKTSKIDAPIPINGLVGGIAIHFAGCCHPLPEDEILGVIHTGRGITVHSSDCKTLKSFASAPEMIVNLSWDGDQGTKQPFASRLKVIIANEPGALARFTADFAKENINITNFKITQRNVDFFEFFIDIEVANLTKINSLINHFSNKKPVYSIERTKL